MTLHFGADAALAHVEVAFCPVNVYIANQIIGNADLHHISTKKESSPSVIPAQAGIQEQRTGFRVKPGMTTVVHWGGLGYGGKSCGAQKDAFGN